MPKNSPVFTLKVLLEEQGPVLSSCQPKSNCEVSLGEGTLLQTSKQGHTRDHSQGSVLLNKGWDLSLFRETLHKHQEEVGHRMYRWGHFCTGAVRKCGYTYIFKNGGKSPPLRGDFSTIMRVYEKSSWGGHRGTFKLLWPVSGGFNQIIPLNCAIHSGFEPEK